MADFDIALPPHYPSLVAGAMRNAQYAPAPAAPDFDANVAAAKADAQHRESLALWRQLALAGHAGAQAVVAHPQVAAKLGPPVPLAAFKPVPSPPPVTAAVPRAPRAPVPTAPQPTPALAGISRRTEVLSSLLGAKSAPAPDKLV
jgi:hypothetical protein